MTERQQAVHLMNSEVQMKKYLRSEQVIFLPNKNELNNIFLLLIK